MLIVVKWFLLTVGTVLAVWFLVSLFKYRITSGTQEREIQGVVLYKVIEVNLTNRYLFETLFGKRVVRLEGFPPFFVSKEDWARLWPENPRVMREKGYTVKARIRSKSLFFGGLVDSKVVATEIVSESPTIRK